LIARSPLPSVNVIIPNRNGQSSLATCLSSVLSLDYPADRLWVTVVDCHSTDGSLRLLHESFPAVQTIALSRDVGPSAAGNRGVQQFPSDLVAFLSPTVRVDRLWLRSLVAALQDDPQRSCVSSVILDEDGTNVRFAGGEITFSGHAVIPGRGVPFEPNPLRPIRPILFPNRAAMLLQRPLFLGCGGFDEDYYAALCDVDLGWRLWVLGKQVHLVQDSIAYDGQALLEPEALPYRDRVIVERNAVWSMVKNYEEQHLRRLLPLATLLASQRAHAAIPQTYPPAQNGTEAETKVSPAVAAILAGLREAGNGWSQMLARRHIVQLRRQRPDREIFARFPVARTPPSFPGREYGVMQKNLLSTVEVNDVVGHKRTPSLLVLSPDPLGSHLTRAATRCWEIAGSLAEEMGVLLAAPDPITQENPALRLYTYDAQEEATLLRLATAADAVLAPASLVAQLPCLHNLGKPLIVDLGDTFIGEGLARAAHQPPAVQQKLGWEAVANLDIAALAGDFFIAGNERQRDLWLGVLWSHGRINPLTYADERALNRLVAIVPPGVPGEPPHPAEPTLKGVYPGISAEDRLILWPESIQDTSGPGLLLEILSELIAERPHIKLCFLVEEEGESPEADDLRRMADQFGLLEKNAFFLAPLPYNERQRYLLEADFVVHLQQSRIETGFACRTGLLNAIWASLPLVVSPGDPLADWVSTHELGHVVDADDREGWAKALISLLDDPDFRERARPRFQALAGELAWENQIRPIVEFMYEPELAADALVVGDATRLAAGAREYPQALQRTVQFWQDQVEQRDELIERIAKHRLVRWLGILREQE